MILPLLDDTFFNVRQPEDPRYQVLLGDNRKTLRELPDKSVQCVVTSPPYFGLRCYNVKGQIGHERTPKEFVDTLIEVFTEVHRVLRDDGTLWLNLGDSYSGSGKGVWNVPEERKRNVKESYRPNVNPVKTETGLPPKSLIGIPWRVAFALQDAGWVLRNDNIWHKPNPTPSSVRDRCTVAHEYLFMFSKTGRYRFDQDAIRNAPSPALLRQVAEGYKGRDTKDYAAAGAQSASGTKARIIEGARKKLDAANGDTGVLGSNKQTVWTITPKPYKGAHFATFPPELVEPCILAGSRPGDLVLDPFGGSGTTAAVALKHGRRAVLCELNPEYLPLIQQRIAAV